MFETYVILTKTDTTVGFLSQDAERLTSIKQRPPHKHYIRAVDSLYTLKTMVRVPAAHKRRIRRSKRTTFIMPNTHSYRIIHDERHLLLLSRMKWAYTTSANLSDHSYDENFAREHADVIVEPLGSAQHPSDIFKLGHVTVKRIR